VIAFFKIIGIPLLKFLQFLYRALYAFVFGWIVTMMIKGLIFEQNREFNLSSRSQQIFKDPESIF